MFPSRIKKVIINHIPILGWIRHYKKEDALSDLIAGITISLTMIPQSIAYASLASLTPRDGLNSAFMGCFIYVFFGTIKEVVIGPTSLMALLTHEYTHRLHSIDFVVLLCFLCGLVELLMGLLRLGFLVNYISTPVVSGFTTATSVIIVVSQIKGIIGVSFSSDGFIDNIKKLYENLPRTAKGDLILGLSCIIVLLMMRSLKDIKVPRNVKGKHVIEKALWFLSIGRNALAVIVTSWLTYRFESFGDKPPFKTTGEVQSGLPTFTLPPFSTTINNRTFTFGEMVSELRTGIAVIPVVSVLANVAIAKAYVQGGVKGNQEMLSLALCNIFGSFVHSMPTCGAFTRSAVISASGVRTPLAGLYSAGITLLALKYLADYFHLIPKATLSAILISAVIFLIDYQIFSPLWKSSKRDFGTLIGTLGACLLFGVEKGLIFGVAVGILHLVFLWSKPSCTQIFLKTKEGQVALITPHMGLFYPSVDYLNKIVLKTVDEHPGVTVIINCVDISNTDFTSVKSLWNIARNLEKREIELSFVNVSKKFINIWKNSGCGNMNITTLEKFESEHPEGKTKLDVVSIININDRRASQHEAINLLNRNYTRN